jgi:hypothetical protein
MKKVLLFFKRVLLRLIPNRCQRRGEVEERKVPKHLSERALKKQILKAHAELQKIKGE